jgi:hypothetical protein
MLLMRLVLGIPGHMVVLVRRMVLDVRRRLLQGLASNRRGRRCRHCGRARRRTVVLESEVVVLVMPMLVR